MVFENRPPWVPNLDERADFSGKRQVSNGLSEFEQSCFYAAKALNTSRLRSQRNLRILGLTGFAGDDSYRLGA
jgi:hypothetical protein